MSFVLLFHFKNANRCRTDQRFINAIGGGHFFNYLDLQRKIQHRTIRAHGTCKKKKKKDNYS